MPDKILKANSKIKKIKSIRMKHKMITTLLKLKIYFSFEAKIQKCDTTKNAINMSCYLCQRMKKIYLNRRPFLI